MAKLQVLRSYIVYCVILILAFISFFPILHIILVSVKEPVDAFAMPPRWIFVPIFRYHFHIWMKTDFPRYFINSMIISLVTVGISVPVASLASYYLARYESRRTRIVLFALLAIRAFPWMLFIIPFFIITRYLGLYDTLAVMILIMVGFNQPLAIWLMRGFIREVPFELEESAIIDGCSQFGVFWRIILPTVLPGLAATSIFVFLLAYNNFLFALILTGTQAKTLPVAVAEYGAEQIQYWSISAAGACGIIAPIVLIMLFLQRYFVKGLVAGAIK